MLYLSNKLNEKCYNVGHIIFYCPPYAHGWTPAHTAHNPPARPGIDLRLRDHTPPDNILFNPPESNQVRYDYTPPSCTCTYLRVDTLHRSCRNQSVGIRLSSCRNRYRCDPPGHPYETAWKSTAPGNCMVRYADRAEDRGTGYVPGFRSHQGNPHTF